MKPEAKLPEVIATLRDVTVTYDGYQTRALSHVNLDIRRGLVTGVLGVKGAGKSTALKILAGRMGPTEGKVKVFGHSPRGAAKGRVGYLLGKSDANHPGFLGRLFGKKGEGPSPARGVARVARAMLGNRDLVVLDDPFAELDGSEITEAKALIRDMVARGKTVVLSSDSLMEVKDLCERLVIMDEGKVQAIGTLAELLSGGSAIRFLPAVMPREMVERVLGFLRGEILTFSPATQTPKAEAPKSTVGTADQFLTKLSKEEVKSPVSTKADDSIDHGKLEELTKTKKPE